MASKTFTQLTAVTTLAAGDELVQWNASAGAARKITVANFIANSPNGGLAEKGAANVFTAGQTINSPSAGTIGLVINTAASPSVAPLVLHNNGTKRFEVKVNAAGFASVHATSYAMDHNTTINLGSQIAEVRVINTTSGYYAVFFVQGGLNTVQEIHDPSTQFSTTAGTTGVNCYYSGGSYYVQNYVGVAQNISILLSAG